MFKRIVYKKMTIQWSIIIIFYECEEIDLVNK